MKKPKLADEIALSRVGLNKSVVDAIEKIREAHKSDWKALIIAYRSRFEKRRNWKEKRKLLNELDAKLCEEKKDQDDDDAESDVADEEKSQDEDEAESEVAEVADEQNDDESDIADEKDEAESDVEDAQDETDYEIADNKDEDETESESESDVSDESEVVVEKPVKPSIKKKVIYCIFYRFYRSYDLNILNIIVK